MMGITEKNPDQILQEKIASLPELKKAIDLWMDKTYNESEFYSHIFQIITTMSEDGVKHKEQLERILWKMDELLATQQMFFSGHKSKLSLCIKLEKALRDKMQFLLRNGYSITRFTKPQPTQNNLFNG